MIKGFNHATGIIFIPHFQLCSDDPKQRIIPDQPVGWKFIFFWGDIENIPDCIDVGTDWLFKSYFIFAAGLEIVVDVLEYFVSRVKLLLVEIGLAHQQIKVIYPIIPEVMQQDAIVDLDHNRVQFLLLLCRLI